MIYDSVVIGGGFSGLFMAMRLAEKRPEDRILLLEKNPFAGGRLQTRFSEEKNQKSKTLFEEGAWRIPKDPAHKPLRDFLTKELKMKLVDSEPPKNNLASEPQGSVPFTVSERQAYMSVFASKALGISQDHHKADLSRLLREEMGTGYADIWMQPENPNREKLAYSAKQSSGFQVAKKGFSCAVHRMLQKVRGNKKTDVFFLAQVQDVVRPASHQDTLTKICIRKRGKADTHPASVLAKKVFLALPPEASRKWPSFYKKTILTHACVTSLPLCHIYVKTSPRVLQDVRQKIGEKNHMVSPDSLLQQTTVLPYKNQWLQVSYSAGRVSRLWQQWYFSMEEKNFRILLQGQLQKLLGYKNKPEIYDTSFCFWENAVHYFRPGLGFKLLKTVSKCLWPSPRDFPNVFVVGEAYSSYQGWLMGCVETCEKVLQQAFKKQQRVEKEDSCQSQTIRINSWKIDFGEKNVLAREWLEKHPGGKNVLKKYMGKKDSAISVLGVNHSETALATALYLAESI